LGVGKLTKMVKLIADYGTYGLWILSTRQAVLDFVHNGNLNLSSMSFMVSVLGIVWTIVKIANAVLDGRINREKTRLENERLLREIWELEEYNREDEINERHQ